MKFKDGVIEVKESSGDKEVTKTITGEKEPYTWALETLKRLVVKSNVSIQKKTFFSMRKKQRIESRN
jgi:hypothetical protein